MARPKKETVAIEKYAILKYGRKQQIVKAWQYYSIYSFLMWCGEKREVAEKIALWCRDSAKNGDSRISVLGYSISIEEREVKYYTPDNINKNMVDNSCTSSIENA